MKEFDLNIFALVLLFLNVIFNSDAVLKQIFNSGMSNEHIYFIECLLYGVPICVACWQILIITHNSTESIYKMRLINEFSILV